MLTVLSSLWLAVHILAGFVLACFVVFMLVEWIREKLGMED
jgi:hypothetical protein